MYNFISASTSRKIAALSLYVGTALLFTFGLGVDFHEYWAVVADLWSTASPVLVALIAILGLGLGHLLKTGTHHVFSFALFIATCLSLSLAAYGGYTMIGAFGWSLLGWAFLGGVVGAALALTFLAVTEPRTRAHHSL